MAALTINPSEHNVSAMRAFNGRERHGGKGTHEDCCLSQVLSGDAALCRVLPHQQAEGRAAHRPGQP